MFNNNTNNLNILFNIRGDKKLGNRLIILLILYILMFLILYFIFKRFPHKYSKLSNNFEKNYQKGDYLIFNSKKNLTNDIIWTSIYENDKYINQIYFDFKLYLKDKFNDFNKNNNPTQKERNNISNYFSIYLIVNFRILSKENITQNDLKFNTFNITNSVKKNDRNFEIYFNKKIIFNCFNSICTTNFNFNWNILKYNKFLTQIFFKNIKVYSDIISLIEIDRFVFNINYKTYYIIYRSLITVMVIIFFIFYLINIKKYEKIYHCFEQRFLILLGIMYILYNDPFFFIKLYIPNSLYLIINSIELISFFTTFLYFNLVISIRMNYYDGKLDSNLDCKINFLFIIFFIISLVVLIVIELNNLFNPIMNIKNNLPLILNVLKYVVVFIFLIIFLIMNINFILVFCKFKIKTNRTKGLVLFSFLFNIFFIGNLLTTYYIYHDLINTEILFYTMINFYFTFLLYFFSFKKKNFINIKKQNNDNISIITKEEILDSNKKIVDQNEIENFDNDKLNLK